MNPSIQHQSHLKDYDTSYKSMDPANRREIEEIIAVGTVLVLDYDGKHCPRCKAFTWGEHWCYSCGWVLAVLAPGSLLPTVGKKLGERQYGTHKCKRCHQPFEAHAPNSIRCEPCRRYLRAHRGKA